MGNFRYNFFDGRWVPYVEAGAGYGFTSTSGDSTAFNEIIADVSGGLTYQAGVGLRYDISDNVGLYVAYRYVSMPQIEINFYIPAETYYSYPAASETVEIDFSSRYILAGIRLTF